MHILSQVQQTTSNSLEQPCDEKYRLLLQVEIYLQTRCTEFSASLPVLDWITFGRKLHLETSRDSLKPDNTEA